MYDTNTDVSTHWCPRRAESIHQAPGPDTWADRPSLTGGIGPSCSYCGSLNPDVFMAKIRDGWIVGPTDKPWKAYLDQPFTSDEIQRIKTGSITWKTARRLKLDEGATKEEATTAADTDWDTHEAPKLTGRTVAKFYFVHLSVEQQAEFLALHNTRAMRLSYPGHLYVLPFFARTAAEATSNGTGAVTS